MESQADTASKPCTQSRVLYRIKAPSLVAMQGFWLAVESSSKKPAEDSVVLPACRWKGLTKPLKFSAGQAVFSQCKLPKLLLSQELFPTPHVVLPSSLPDYRTTGKKTKTILLTGCCFTQPNEGEQQCEPHCMISSHRFTEIPTLRKIW